MENILKNKDKRSNYFLTLSLISVLLILIRLVALYTLDENNEIVKVLFLFIDSMFISLLTTILLSWLYYKIGRINNKESFKLIKGEKEIGKKFHKERKETRFWGFNGGIGRYSRFKTLPLLHYISKKKNKTINVELVIINPNNPDLCQKYADYKNKFKPDGDKNWNKELVRKNIFATILKSVFYENPIDNFKVNIFVKDYFSVSRYDINYDMLIISNINQSIPIIEITKESHLYMPYFEDFVQTKNQATQIIFSKDISLPCILKYVTKNEAIRFFDNIANLKSPLESEIDEILKIIENDYDIHPTTYKPKN
ncbi:hypothetical protein P8625_13230 [Tenacibaculum tangerinum]|uniref:Uncharacterized protein n=1 Tax=Tenacibaculum tangerinum TaxID=3038772 RepID=A0ABY8L0N4_9FLAO|nr:hypothetical protein [Tenacibaculum tangerinum]WGH75026.1 hypothetical protein P8625_13230 [Tenacibaculum tangerinum]